MGFLVPLLSILGTVGGVVAGAKTLFGGGPSMPDIAGLQPAQAAGASPEEITSRERMARFRAINSQRSRVQEQTGGSLSPEATAQFASLLGGFPDAFNWLNIPGLGGGGGLSPGLFSGGLTSGGDFDLVGLAGGLGV